MSSNIASTLIRLAGAAGMCLLPSLAGAQGALMERNISLALARDIANVAMDTCAAKGFRVSITVVDRNGMVRLSYRGDGTNPHTVENSFRKALHVAHVPYSLGRVRQASQGQSDHWPSASRQYHCLSRRAADQGRRRHHRRGRCLRRARRQ